jgi:hypothetical protein
LGDSTEIDRYLEVWYRLTSHTNQTLTNPFFTKRSFFDRPKLQLVQLWHLISNHSAIFELEWHGS